MTEEEISRAVEDNEKLVYYTIKKFYPALLRDDDIVQIGRIGLWNACCKYDASKGQFSTFAVSGIRYAILRELRDRGAQKRDGECELVSINAPIDDMNKTGMPLTLENIIPDPNDPYVVINYGLPDLEQLLSKRELDVFRLSAIGYTMEEIGKKYGYTRQWASLIVTKARKKIRKAIKKRAFR